MADLKRTDIALLKAAASRPVGVLRRQHPAIAGRRMLDAGYVVPKKGVRLWLLAITPAGREALRAATNPETKPS